MRKLITCLFLLIALSSQLSAQECDHSRGRTQNDLIPNLRIGIIPRPVTENSAVALFGEVGKRNYRANGTFGWLLGYEDRVKFSGEYLTQKLGYHFSTGRENRWVHQYAAGVEYEHDFCNSLFPNGDVSFYYSYAPDRNLGSTSCEGFLYQRRIDGSNSYEISAGTTISPWCWGIFHVEADYDSVNYRRKFSSDKHISGFGFSASYHQDLCYHLFFDLIAEFKRPYNYGKARLSWYNAEWSGFAVGLYGSHTRGKSHLPSNTSAGLELTYIFGDMICCPTEYSPCYCGPELASWVGNPAVYMPEVLAIAEERRSRFVPVCEPLSVTAIPNFSFANVNDYSIDIKPYFISPNDQVLTYSAIGLPPGSTIVNGVISGPVLPNNQTYIISVAAIPVDGCAAVTQVFTISFPCAAPTSVTIPNQNFAALVGDPYGPVSFSSFFTSPNGQPFTFIASGLPAGSTLSSSGVLTGVAVAGGPFAVTITGVTACGSTQRIFELSFSSQ